MTTDFEYKLKENLIKDVEETNVDVLSEVMRTPFAEPKKKFSFFDMPRRAVATICASVLLLCVGVFASDSLFASQEEAQPMPMSMSASDMARTIESDAINISDSLQVVLLQVEMEDTVEVAVLSSFTKEDVLLLASLDRAITTSDFAELSPASSDVIIVELSKSSIIDMKDFFYFMLPSEA